MSEYKKKELPELLLHFFKIYPLRFLISLTALLLAGFVEIIGVGALLPLLNLVFEQENTSSGFLNQAVQTLFNTLAMDQTFENLLILMVVAILLKAVIVFFALRIVAYVAIDISYDLRKNFIHSLIHAEWGYYSSLNIGRSANAIATEADYAGQFCVLVGKTITAAIQVAVYTLIAMSIDWKVSVAAIFLGSLSAFLLKFLVQYARDAGTNMASTLNHLLSRLNESLSGAKAIKAMGAESKYIDLLNNDAASLQDSRKKLALSTLLLNLIHEPLLIFFMALGLAWAHNYANYPVTFLLVLAFLFSRLLSQMNMVQNHYQKTAIFEGALNAILEKTQTARGWSEKRTGKQQPNLIQNIRFEKVTLSYGENIIINQFDEEIKSNQMTVIFGPSGSGKSSMLDAILGLLPITNGTVYLDDLPLQEVDINLWRKMIGYVPQDTFLFHDSIAANIALGDDSISHKSIIDALKIAQAWRFVEQLDDGIQHVVGERGGKLSGGQKQRIALARAIVRKPKLLILDEATSGLDKNVESAILKALKAILPTTTILLISHDPKIINLADYVIRLDQER